MEQIPPHNVPAAPNSSKIKAKVIRSERSATFQDKWYLELEILESQSLEGPNFARVGERAKGFMFGRKENVPRTGIITAQAEFLGDESGGMFQLSQVAVSE
jgi:hypothetical protein